MRVAGAHVRAGLVLALLVAAHFTLRPMLGDSRLTPDFVLVALLFFAIRVRPAWGAVAGLLVGIVTDSVSPTAFGAAALALTIVGYAAGWLKAVVFADNLLVNALFVFSAAWVRDVIQALVSRQLEGGALAWQLLALSPMAAGATALAAVVTLVVFRGWLRQAGA